MFTTLNSHQEAHNAISNYLASSPAISAELLSELQSAFQEMSVVDRFIKVAETMYANKDGLDNAGLLVCAQVVAWCSHPSNGFGGYLQSDLRGAGIVNACLRQAGQTPPQGYTWPDAAADPSMRAHLRLSVSEEVTEE